MSNYKNFYVMLFKCTEWLSMQDYLRGLKSIAYNETDKIASLKGRNFQTKIVFPLSLKTVDVGYFDFQLFFSWICEYSKILEGNEWKLFSFAEEIFKYEKANHCYKGQKIEMPKNFIDALNLDVIKNYVFLTETQDLKNFEKCKGVFNCVEQKFHINQKFLYKFDYEYT